MRQITFLFLLLTLSFSLKAQPTSASENVLDSAKTLAPKPLENSLVWKFYLEGKTDTSYLFGTIHLPVKKAYEVVDTVISLIQKVNRVFFEIENDPSAMLKLAKTFMAKNEEDKIKNLLSDTDYVALKKLASENLGMQAIAIDFMVPFGVLSVLAQSMIEGDTTMVMDMGFQVYAKTLGKEVGGLETVEEQLAALDNFSREEQLKSIVEMIHDYDNQKKVLDTLMTAYIEQDLEAIKDFTEESEADWNGDWKSALLDDRNIKMAEKIHQLAFHDPCLIGIGAAHLVGEIGVIQLLKNKGFVFVAVNPAQE